MPIIDIDGVFTQTFQVVGYNFSLCNLVLHKSITIVIFLLDADNIQFHRIEKQIEGEEYNAWGLDDSYLEGLADKFVKEFLNIAEPIEEEPIAEPIEEEPITEPIEEEPIEEEPIEEPTD